MRGVKAVARALLIGVVAVPACAATVRCAPTTGLQACLDAATARGTRRGTAVVPARTTFPLAATAVLYPRLTLRCEPGSVMVQADGANLEVMLRNRGQGDEPGITIDSCTLDGNAAHNRGVRTVGLRLLAERGYALRDLRITNSSFRDTSDMAIIGAGWVHAAIVHNTFSDTGRHDDNTAALWLFAQFGASHDIRVADNRCDNTGIRTGCFKFTAEEKSPLTRISITRNTVLPGDSPAADTSGIELFSGDSQAAISGFDIADNEVRGPNSTNARIFGISVGGAMQGTVRRNHVTDSRAFGIEVVGSAVRVRDNVLLRSGPITWDAREETRHDIAIVRNQLLDTAQRGIFFYAAGGHCLAGAVITGNVIRALRGPALRLQNSNPQGGCGDAAGRFGVRDVRFRRNQVEAGSTEHPLAEVLGAAQGIRLEDNLFHSGGQSSIPAVVVTDDAEITLRGNRFQGLRPLFRGERARLTDSGGNTHDGTAVPLRATSP